MTESQNNTKSQPQMTVQMDRKKRLARSFKRNILSNWELYLMYVPGFLCLLVFSYAPLYGLQLAFKQYAPALGIWGSPWVGWENFQYAVLSRGFLHMVGNTLMLGLLKIIFAFPSSIILALMMNELTCRPFKKVVQTFSYLPYFISWVIVSSIANMFLTRDGGILNQIIVAFGGEKNILVCRTQVLAGHFDHLQHLEKHRLGNHCLFGCPDRDQPGSLRSGSV